MQDLCECVRLPRDPGSGLMVQTDTVATVWCIQNIYMLRSVALHVMIIVSMCSCGELAHGCAGQGVWSAHTHSHSDQRQTGV